MPFLTLAATPSSGHNEVLKTLQLLGRRPSGASVGAGASVREIALSLQYSGHYGRHAAALTILEAEISPVLTALMGLGTPLVQSTASAYRRGEESTTGYSLTRAGELAAKRVKPFALRP